MVYYHIMYKGTAIITGYAPKPSDIRKRESSTLPSGAYALLLPYKRSFPVVLWVTSHDITFSEDGDMYVWVTLDETPEMA